MARAMRNRVLGVPEFRLESGRVLRGVEVAFQTFGRAGRGAEAEAAAREGRVIVVCHALSGSADAADWWAELVGPGRALDTDANLVVCCNMLGSPYGTTSPLSTDPDSGAPYGTSFPRTTVRDSVRLHRLVLGHLGARSVRAVVGGSLGGMQALEWALMYPRLVRSLVLAATCGRHSAWAVALGEAQRRAIDAHPVLGLEVARQMALVSYRSHASFGRRFGRKPNARPPRPPRAPGTDMFPAFSVEGYLEYQGGKFGGRFDAECYRHITLTLDSHDVARGRAGSYEQVLGGVRAPVLVFGIESDLLYPLSEQEELARLMPNARLVVLDSDDGHDAFLIDWRTLEREIVPFLRSNGGVKK